MRWVLRCDVATERRTGAVAAAAGSGHLERCRTLAAELERRGGEATIVLGGDPEAVAIVRDGSPRSIVAAEPDDLAQIASLAPDGVIVDINHLPGDRVDRIRSLAPTINLAPRGAPKYVADLTIINTTVLDGPGPPEGRHGRWYRGPRYAIVRPEFAAARGSTTTEGDGLVVCLGGVDQADLTSAVLRELEAVGRQVRVDVVVGALNPNVEAVRDTHDRLGFDGFVHVQPDHLADLFAGASVAVLGIGNLVDEALTVGVPTVGVALGDYHVARGAELRALGLLAVGDRTGVTGVAAEVEALLTDPTLRRTMRRRARRVYDGRGTGRAAQLCTAFVSGTSLAVPAGVGR